MAIKKSADEQFFRAQVEKMSKATDAIIGLEVPAVARQIPFVRILEATTEYGPNWVAQSVLAPAEPSQYEIRPVNGLRAAAVLIWKPIPLDEYLSDYVIGCSHGDQDSAFVAAISESQLSKLEVLVTTT